MRPEVIVALVLLFALPALVAVTGIGQEEHAAPAAAHGASESHGGSEAEPAE